jgi:carbamoyl-phosphate synthase large subunit
MINVLITGACGVTSRSVARGLKRDNSRDFNLIGVGIFENSYAIFEGIYDKIFKVPKNDNEKYEFEIKKLIKFNSIDVAIIIPEPEVSVWSKIKFDVPHLVPDAKFIEKAADKNELAISLKHTPYIPKSFFFDRLDSSEGLLDNINYPAWARLCHFGVTSGKGARRVDSKDALMSLINKYTEKSKWQIADFVNGRNIAVSLLFKDGMLLNFGMYERIKYFSADLFESGVSGNISEGRIFFDRLILDQVLFCINEICKINRFNANGFITVDLLLPEDNTIKITEVNVRPTAPVEAYSLVGNKILLNWIEAALDKPLTPSLNSNLDDTRILRDIDGRLIVVDHFDLARHKALKKFESTTGFPQNPFQ